MSSAYVYETQLLGRMTPNSKVSLEQNSQKMQTLSKNSSFSHKKIETSKQIHPVMDITPYNELLDQYRNLQRNFKPIQLGPQFLPSTNITSKTSKISVTQSIRSKKLTQSKVKSKDKKKKSSQPEQKECSYYTPYEFSKCLDSEVSCCSCSYCESDDCSCCSLDHHSKRYKCQKKYKYRTEKSDKVPKESSKQYRSQSKAKSSERTKENKRQSSKRANKSKSQYLEKMSKQSAVSTKSQPVKKGSLSRKKRSLSPKRKNMSVKSVRSFKSEPQQEKVVKKISEANIQHVIKRAQDYQDECKGNYNNFYHQQGVFNLFVFLDKLIKDAHKQYRQKSQYRNEVKKVAYKKFENSFAWRCNEKRIEEGKRKNKLLEEYESTQKRNIQNVVKRSRSYKSKKRIEEEERKVIAEKLERRRKMFRKEKQVVQSEKEVKRNEKAYGRLEEEKKQERERAKEREKRLKSLDAKRKEQLAKCKKKELKGSEEQLENDFVL